MWKRLGTLFLLLLFAFSLEAQELTYTWKDQALQELTNIEQQNLQLQKIIEGYEKNYNDIKSLVETQEKSLQVKDQALKNLEKSLRNSQTVNIIFILTTFVFLLLEIKNILYKL